MVVNTCLIEGNPVMASSYDIAGRLRAPVLVTDGQEAPLFYNRALEAKLPALCRATPRSTSLRDETGRLAALSEGEGCLGDCLVSRRHHGFFCLLRRGSRYRFFLESQAVGQLLLSELDWREAEASLSQTALRLLAGEEETPRTACRRVAEERAPAVLAVTVCASLAETACRLLFGMGCLTDETEEGLVAEEAHRFFEAFGEVLERLMADRDEGIAPAVTLVEERGELAFLLPDAVIAAGRCRILSAVRHPEAFYFRRNEVGTAFLLAASAEMTARRSGDDGLLG